jgi:hypothetical protein
MTVGVHSFGVLGGLEGIGENLELGDSYQMNDHDEAYTTNSCGKSLMAKTVIVLKGYVLPRF